MKTDYATLKLYRGKRHGRGQRTVLSRYDKDGNLIGQKTGTSAYKGTGTLRRNGIPVIVL